MGEPEENTFDQIWDMYLTPLKEKVRQRATQIAKRDSDRSEIIASDAFDALREYIPGGPVTPAAYGQTSGWFNRNVTGFIGITAILTLCFGALGLVPFFSTAAAQSSAFASAAQGFLEIAKIFAGALVGGAAGVAVTNAAR